jgi:hypothetical protein
VLPNIVFLFFGRYGEDYCWGEGSSRISCKKLHTFLNEEQSTVSSEQTNNLMFALVLS